MMSESTISLEGCLFGELWLHFTASFPTFLLGKLKTFFMRGERCFKRGLPPVSKHEASLDPGRTHISECLKQKVSIFSVQTWEDKDKSFSPFIHYSKMVWVPGSVSSAILPSALIIIFLKWLCWSTDQEAEAYTPWSTIQPQGKVKRCHLQQSKELQGIRCSNTSQNVKDKFWTT